RRPGALRLAARRLEHQRMGRADRGDAHLRPDALRPEQQVEHPVPRAHASVTTLLRCRGTAVSSPLLCATRSPSTCSAGRYTSGLSAAGTSTGKPGSPSAPSEITSAPLALS